MAPFFLIKGNAGAQYWLLLSRMIPNVSSRCISCLVLSSILNGTGNGLQYIGMSFFKTISCSVFFFNQALGYFSYIWISHPLRLTCYFLRCMHISSIYQQVFLYYCSSHDHSHRIHNFFRQLL